MENFSMRFMAKALKRAKTGRPGRFSRIMQEVIPFNRPHRISISEITSEGCVVHLPYRRRNLNHLGTMHACAMATAGEYVSGLNVIEAFDISKYRLIMSRLEVDYLRRPVGECNARSSGGDGVLQSLTSDISEKGVAVFTLTSELRDSKSVHVATTTTHWQVKSWDKVRVRS
jgi:acyl-coenzyme A thioesterase PaaI-like protein